MDNTPALWWDMVKVALLLGGMLLLGKNAPAIFSRLSGNPALKRQRRMHLLDSLYLGTDKSVHLVEVDGVRLVLGASRGSINLLTEMPAVEEPAVVVDEASVVNPAQVCEPLATTPNTPPQAQPAPTPALPFSWPDKEALQRYIGLASRALGRFGSQVRSTSSRAYGVARRVGQKAGSIAGRWWRATAEVITHGWQCTATATGRVIAQIKANTNTTQVQSSTKRTTPATRESAKQGKAGKGAAKTSRRTA